MQHLDERHAESLDQCRELDPLQIDADGRFLQGAAHSRQVADQPLHELEIDQLFQALGGFPRLVLRVMEDGQEIECLAAELFARDFAERALARRVDADHEEREVVRQVREHVPHEGLEAADLCA